MTWSAPIDRTMSSVLCAADPGHVRSERLRDLHRERPDAAGRTVDQHPLPRLDFALIANGGQRSERGVSNRRRLLKREVGRLGQEIALRSTRILGERALAPAEHLIARPKLLDASPGRLNLPCDIESRYLAPRPAAGQPPSA